MTTVYVSGRPKPKERPRHSKNGHTYTPKSTQDYESIVRQAWVDAGGVLLEGPVSMVTEFTVDGVLITVKPLNQPVSKMRGDIDNYTKSVMDALQGVAFLNDKQVQSQHSTKQ